MRILLVAAVISALSLTACESMDHKSKRVAAEQAEDPLFPSELALNNATGASTIISPVLTDPITKSTVTFKWDTAPGATRYFLGVGTSAQSVNVAPYGDIFALSMTAAKLSVDVSNIPVRGEPVHVRLWTMINGKWATVNYVVATQTTNEDIGKTVDKLTKDAITKLDKINAQNTALSAQNTSLAAQNAQLLNDLTATKNELKASLENISDQVSDVESKIEQASKKTVAFADCVAGSERQKIYGSSSLDLVDECKLWAGTMSATTTWSIESAGTILLPASAYIRGRCNTQAKDHGYYVGQSSLEIRRACLLTATQTSSVFRSLTDVSFQQEQDSSDSSSLLICEPYNSYYSYVVRRSDLTRIGASVDHSACATIVRNARNGLVCEPSSTYYAFVTRISDKTRVSTGSSSIDSCNSFVRSSRTSITCVPTDSYWAKMYNLTTGTFIGAFTEHSQCVDNVNSSRLGLACVAADSYWSKITRLADNVQIGTSVTSSQCNKHVANANNNIICAPQDSYWSKLTKIDTNEKLGGFLEHDACIALPK